MPRTRLLAVVALLAAVTAAVAAAVARKRTDPPAPAVRLAVLVVFDQMRGDYVETRRPLFGPGGFARLRGEGAWFPDCHYPYATTTTGPGHASMLTGASPDRHGIINNDWFDRAAGAEVYCAGSDRYEIVPAPPRPAADPSAKKPDVAPRKPRAVGTPDRLLSPTVADVLKKATAGRGKVFGLSLKDRSAIFPTGKSPDGAYWFSGRFVTSTYYRDAVHPWVAAFNRSGTADRWRGAVWDRVRTDLDYAAHSGPDVAPGEGTGEPPPEAGAKAKPVVQQGVAFPHPMDAGKAKPGDAYYAALANSPFGNDLLLEFAKACIVAEQLGQDDTPDLLTVSFSSNDLIGHTWGPDSQEVLDVTLRSDRVMAELLGFLDAKVGRGNYAVAVTADHGICPLPEAAAARRVDAGRVAPKPLQTGAETHLAKAFPAAPGTPPAAFVEKVSAPWVYLNNRLIAARGLSGPGVAASLAGWLRTRPGVQRAYTRAELAADAPDDDALTRRVKRSYHPDRAGDVYLLLQPYHLLTDRPTGTSHGTPYPYDTHVPLLVLGPGVPGGTRTESVAPQHAAAILARFLGVPPPADAAYPVPASLFKN